MSDRAPATDVDRAGERGGPLAVVTHPAAIVLIAALVVLGAAGGTRQGAGVIPRYRAQSVLAIEAQLHTTAQASVVATGGDVVVQKLVTDPAFVAELGGEGSGLTLTTLPAGADRIRVEAEHRDPEVTARAAALAARRIIAAAAEQRAATQPATAAGPEQPAIDSPQLTWARETFETYRRRSTMLDDAARARDRDALLVAILERGADAGRQGLAIQQQVSARVQSTLAGVTLGWYMFPLRVEGEPQVAQPTRTRPVRRMAIGGAMVGLGSGLLLLALVGAVGRARGASSGAGGAIPGSRALASE